MLESNNIGEAVKSYVESLEEEQKNGKLIENDRVKKVKENLCGIGKIAEFIKRVVELICLGEEVDIKVDTDNNKVSVYGKDLGIAIGRDGKNMRALEFIVNLIRKRKKIVERNVVVDIKDYKKRKFEKVEKIAKRMARKAISEGKKITLKPMCSYERKIVHDVLSGLKEVRTKSKNSEPYRRIVIYPINDSK